MKLQTSLVVAALACVPAFSGAFTLDAAGYGGSGLSPAPCSAFVPGYGEIVFETAEDTPLAVSSAYPLDGGCGVPALAFFHEDDAVRLTFDGRAPQPGEFFAVREDLFAARVLSGTTGGSGAELPGMLGAVALALRRRR